MKRNRRDLYALSPDPLFRGYVNEQPLFKEAKGPLSTDPRILEALPEFQQWLLRNGHHRDSDFGVSRSGLFTDFS